MQISEIKKEIHEVANDKGFWDNKDRNIGELLMLCVSELAEALEADREDRYANIESLESLMDDYNPKWLNTEGEHFTENHWFIVNFEGIVKDSFEDEIADTIIRLLDLCEGLDIPIERHIRYKIDYNKTRSNKHGKKY